MSLMEGFGWVSKALRNIPESVGIKVYLFSLQYL